MWESREEAGGYLKTLRKASKKTDILPSLEGYTDICHVNHTAFSVVGAMGLQHRKGTRKLGQVIKCFRCSAEANGGFLSLKMTWSASNSRKKTYNSVKTSLCKEVTREEAVWSLARCDEGFDQTEAGRSGETGRSWISKVDLTGLVK